MWAKRHIPPIFGLFGPIRVPYPKGFGLLVKPLVKSLFCPINASPNEFLVRTPPNPPHLKPTFLRLSGRGGGGVGGGGVGGGSKNDPPLF